jgi:hypothetical protein
MITETSRVANVGVPVSAQGCHGFPARRATRLARAAFAKQVEAC